MKLHPISVSGQKMFKRVKLERLAKVPFVDSGLDVGEEKDNNVLNRKIF